MTDWEIVGCPPTTDLRELKRAYAKALRLVPPEKDQAGFLRLREAYERLVARLERAARSVGGNEPDDSDPGEWSHASAETEAQECVRRNDRWNRPYAIEKGGRPRRRAWSAHPLVDPGWSDPSGLDVVWTAFMALWKIRANWSDRVCWKDILALPEFEDPRTARGFEARVLRHWVQMFSRTSSLDDHRTLLQEMATALDWRRRKSELIETYGEALIDSIFKVLDTPSESPPTQLIQPMDDIRGRSETSGIIGVVFVLVLVVLVVNYERLSSLFHPHPDPPTQDFLSDTTIRNHFDSVAAVQMNEDWVRATGTTWSETRLNAGLSLPARVFPAKPGESGNHDIPSLELVLLDVESGVSRLGDLYRRDGGSFLLEIGRTPGDTVEICPSGDAERQIVVHRKADLGAIGSKGRSRLGIFETFEIGHDGFARVHPCDARPACAEFPGNLYRSACPAGPTVPKER